MSSSSKANRKGSSKPRESRKRSSHNSQAPSYDGVYGNPHMVHYFLNLMGSKCVLQVQNGSVYSGIFHTVSPEMDLVLAAAHKVECNSAAGNVFSEDGVPSADTLIDELIFRIEDVIHMEARDVNLSYAEVAVKSNGDAGSEVKNFSSANGSELRTLEPWDGGGDSTSPDALGGLEDGLTGDTFNGTNGWQAEDMFRTNLEQYGVKSSYNPDLPEYTTQLENDNSAEYEKRKARASRLAQEIEGSQNYMRNVNLELDDNTTEEEKYSSVVRDYTKHGRGRARPRDPAREPRNQRPGGHGYPGPSSMSRPGYGPGNRTNISTSANETATSPPGQNKPFRQGNNMQGSLPPRFARGNSGNQRESPAYDREADRGGRTHAERVHDNVSHHPGYQGQPKPMRANTQGRGNFSKPMPHQDYSQQPPVDSPIPGQTTPQSLSRESSASSLTQQGGPPPQWKEDERVHGSMPPNSANHPQARNFPSAHMRGERCRNHPVQKVQVIPRILGRPSRITIKTIEDVRYPTPAQQPPSTNLPGRGMPPPASAYPDKGPKHPSQPYHSAIPSKAAKTPQPAKMYLNQKAMPPAVHPQTTPGLPQRQQQQPQRYGSSVPTMPPSGPSPTGQNVRRTAPPGPLIEGSSKAPVLKKTLSGSSSQSAPLSKSGSTGSASDLKTLQDFSKNFKLQLSDAAPSEVPVESKSSGPAAAPRSKSMDETSSNRVIRASKPPRTMPPNQGPPPASTDPSAIAAKPAVSSANGGAVDNFEIASSKASVALAPNQQATSVHASNTAAWQTSGAIKTPPSSPAINIPSPRTASTASDVVTVSASGQYVPSSVETSIQAAAPQKGSSAETSHIAPPTDPITTPSSGKPGSAPSADSSKKELNPNAEEFTPRSFASKSGESNPSNSPAPTPVTPQPIQAAFYNPATGPILAAPSIYVFPKASKGQPILSPSPSEPHVVGVQSHINPTSVGHHILPHPYQAPLVLTQGPTAPQQLATGQPALMHQQQTYANVEQMVYSPQPGHHIMQPAGRAIPTYATTAEYGYQAAHVQQQQQHPSPQHQGQQSVSHQQQGQQPSQPNNYIAQQPQQPQQQQRPHSAHTPNASQIPPASPASNVQPMPVTMSVNPVHVHTPGQNQMIAQHSGYFPQPLLAHQPIHAAPVHPVQNSPHPSYGVAPRGPAYMVVPGQQLPANPGGQHGYMQPAAVVSSANHGQSQYSGGRQYHGQHVIQGYPQAPN